MKQQEQQGMAQSDQRQTQGNIAEIDRKGQWDIRKEMMSKAPVEQPQQAV